MKIQYDGQLLTTTVTVCYRGEVLELNDIIDTGSSHTVFSPLNTLKVEQVVIDVGILPKFHKRLWAGYIKNERLYFGFGQA